MRQYIRMESITGVGPFQTCSIDIVLRRQLDDIHIHMPTLYSELDRSDRKEYYCAYISREVFNLYYGKEERIDLLEKLEIQGISFYVLEPIEFDTDLFIEKGDQVFIHKSAKIKKEQISLYSLFFHSAQEYQKSLLSSLSI